MQIIDMPTEKPRTIKEMKEYLTDHFRYHTMRAWNRSKSYANKIKVYSLNVPKEDKDLLYEALDIEGVFELSGFNSAIREFDRSWDYKYQIGTNGRSGGYLVLYSGEKKKSGYKSYCEECGQNNYKTVEETNGNECGRCGENSRVNYEPGKEPFQVVTFPGKPLGEDISFLEWDKYEFERETELVYDFDVACNKACLAFLDFARNNKPVEKVVMVPKTITSHVHR